MSKAVSQMDVLVTVDLWRTFARLGLANVYM